MELCFGADWLVGCCGAFDFCTLDWNTLLCGRRSSSSVVDMPRESHK